MKNWVAQKLKYYHKSEVVETPWVVGKLWESRYSKESQSKTESSKNESEGISVGVKQENISSTQDPVGKSTVLRLEEGGTAKSSENQQKKRGRKRNLKHTVQQTLVAVGEYLGNLLTRTINQQRKEQVFKYGETGESEVDSTCKKEVSI